MITPDYCQVMAQYNQWINIKLYQLCESIPEDERKKDRGAFFGSIHGTLDHLWYGDRVWLSRFQGVPFTGNIREITYPDFEELKQQRKLIDREIIDWCQEISSEWLAAPFTYKSAVYQKTLVLPAWVLVAHMFNHQTHHRGQLTTLLSQLGCDPGITDLPLMPYLEVFTGE